MTVQPLPTPIAAVWGLGTFATTTMLNGVSVGLLFFLVTFVKVEPVVAGGLLFMAKIFSILTDPVVGHVSDRTATRWGRRRPFLLAGAVTSGFSFALLFNVPQFESAAAVQIFIGLGLIFYSLSYTAFQVPYMAMPAEMVSGYHERTRLMTFRVVFMTLGNTMGVSGCTYLVKLLGNDRAAYGEMALIVGAIISAAMLIVFVGTARAPRTERVETSPPIGQQLKLMTNNTPMMLLVAIKVVQYVAIAASTSVSLFFLASILKRGPDALAIYGLMQTAATIAFTPAAAWLSRQIGKKPAYVGCLVAQTFVILSWLLATPQESMLIFCLRGFAAGICASGLFLYSNAMLVDTFAWDFKLFGLKREGVLAATFSVVEKSALAFGPLIIGALLTAMGFDRSRGPTGDQSAGAQLAMIIGYVLIPVAGYLISITLLWFYRLRQQDVE